MIINIAEHHHYNNAQHHPHNLFKQKEIFVAIMVFCAVKAGTINHKAPKTCKCQNKHNNQQNFSIAFRFYHKPPA